MWRCGLRVAAASRCVGGVGGGFGGLLPRIPDAFADPCAAAAAVGRGGPSWAPHGGRGGDQRTTTAASVRIGQAAAAFRTQAAKAPEPSPLTSPPSPPELTAGAGGGEPTDREPPPSNLPLVVKLAPSAITRRVEDPLHMVVMPERRFVQRLWKRVFGGVPKSHLKMAGYLLMLECAEGPDLKAFLNAFDMPDTFFSWFLVTELHIWMLAVRFMNADPKQGLYLRNTLIEALWEDCNQRAKLVGGQSASERSETIFDLAEQFQATMCIYDFGLIGDDKAISSALWRRFFLCSLRLDGESLCLLVRYVRRTMQALERTNLDDLAKSQTIKWLSLGDRDDGRKTAAAAAAAEFIGPAELQASN